MSEIEGNLRGVLNCVETLVKNIRRRRDLILNSIDGKQCVSTQQLSHLLNTFVDKILDDDNKTSDRLLAQTLTEEPHKDLTRTVHNSMRTEIELRKRINSLEDSLKKESKDKSDVIKNHKMVEKALKDKIQSLEDSLKKKEVDSMTGAFNIQNELRQTITLLEESLKKKEEEVMSVTHHNKKLFEKPLKERIKSLEESLKKETEDKQRIQKHCSKIMEKCQTNEDNHKTQLQELNSNIENLKKSESDLMSQISVLSNRSSVSPKIDSLVEEVKCQVKQELIERSIASIKKEEPEMALVSNGFHNDVESDSESTQAESEAEDQSLKNKCLATTLSVSLERVDVINESLNGSVVEEEVEVNNDSEDDSILDLTVKTNKTKGRRGRKKGISSNYVKDSSGIFTCTQEGCGFSSRTVGLMLAHFRNPPHDRYRTPLPFKCQLCSKRFSMAQGLAVHNRHKHYESKTRTRSPVAQNYPKHSTPRTLRANLRDKPRVSYV